MTNFGFLKPEWPELFESATKAEASVYPDPRAACFYARRTLELAVQWLYKNDKSLKLPYQDNLSALIFEPTFQSALGPTVHSKVKLIKDLGNLAVHSRKVITQYDALTAVRELFHFSFWLARTYGKGQKPADDTAFDQNLLPKTSPIPPQTLAQLKQLGEQLAQKDAKLSEILTGKVALDAELEKLRAEIAAIKEANKAVPDNHDYNEAQTREFFIDLLLKEAGWPLDQKRDTEFPVTGMPNAQGEGFVDYVLWGDDDKPLGLVEAKRTKRSPQVGQQQAKLYADCLEKQFGQRPVIFYSNGYEHWIWDDQFYPPRQVQGFLEKDELELLIQRRTTRQPLALATIDEAIVERYYQTRAIRRIGERFEQDRQRRALLVMATGAGKTRTVIALCDLLMRCNWVKRVLFLADRLALVNQAVGAFKTFLPGSSPVNLVREKDASGRVYVSTYPTMMGLIEETNDGRRRFGPGHFDLVIIDEAHRSVYKKYGAIFAYFDSLLVGLTATPKSEVDRNTYSLFELETGVPTDAYELEDAVRDGYLVRMESVSVPLRFQREGIKYDELSEDEKEEWDALDWGDDAAPSVVEPEAVNRWLFNKDTVDKALEHLMTRGLKVADGDRLGKTIIFAKNHDHAEFIADRFNANYPHFKGEFARVIDFKVEYAQTLIDNFSNAAKAPHIAISVDMLDTGIDIPEIVNLVFFKLVRSKTKFWQMVGRGTRLRPDLFGPGKNKKFFYVFDYCQNLEFFSQNPATTEGASGASLRERLFTARVELIAALDHWHPLIQGQAAGKEGAELRKETAAFLQGEVASMNVNNFIVRPKRQLVERYAKAETWDSLGLEEQSELVKEVAGLPSEQTDEDQEAKEFDLLMLRLELAVLRSDKAYSRLRDQVKKIASKLEEKANIPMVQQQLVLIEEIQTDDFWQGVTAPILENVRKRLRSLVKLIDKAERVTVYTDFEDMLGDESSIELLGTVTAVDLDRFRAKARQFLREHESDPAIHKLRFNEALTEDDVTRLEKILAKVGTPAEIEQVRATNDGLGLFIRSLVGLDREAAKKAFDGFLNGKALNSNQIEFINLVIDHLTQSGWLAPSRLYETPFIDFSARGVDGLFDEQQVNQLISVLDNLRQSAGA